MLQNTTNKTKYILINCKLKQICVCSSIETYCEFCRNNMTINTAYIYNSQYGKIWHVIILVRSLFFYFPLLFYIYNIHSSTFKPFLSGHFSNHNLFEIKFQYRFIKIFVKLNINTVNHRQSVGTLEIFSELANII